MSETEHFPSRCIFCLEEKPLTIEHVFPESIGGKLTIPFVCKDCNSKLGTTVDGKFQKLFQIELNRQQYALAGKKGGCPDAFSGVWNVEDSTSPLKKVRIINGRPEPLPVVETKEDPRGTYVSMVLSSELSPKKQREIIAEKIRRIQLKTNPQLKDTPDKLNEIVDSMTDKALQSATHHSERPMLHQEKIVWNNAGFQEYVKIAYELAFCLYGFSYVMESDTARDLRDAILCGEKALQKVHCRFPASFPETLDPFPDRELFFRIGDGQAFVRMFGMGGWIVVLKDSEQQVYPPRNAYISKLVANSPDVQLNNGRCVWGCKLTPSQQFPKTNKGKGPSP